MQSGISAMVLLLLVPPGIVALYLLISGVRGRRVGDEPRCARCGYILLGLESCNCPECGTEIAPYNTVIGHRKRRPWRATMGFVLLLLACLPLVSPLTNAVASFPWYQLKPAGWVVADLDRPQTYAMAMKELERREKADGLAESIRQSLIERGLQEQAGKAPPAFSFTRQELLDYLGRAIVDGRVTPEQRERFLDQACRITTTVRPIIAEGDQVPFWMWQTGRGPGGNSPIMFWARREDRERRIDGKVVRSSTGGGSGGLSGGGTGSSEVAGPVGKHTLEQDVEFAIWHGAMSEEGQSRLIGRRKVTVQVNYAVVPREQVPKIELLDSEELRKQVQAAVKVTSFAQQKEGYISANFEMTKPPCDMAFDVFVVTEKGETKIGSINCGKGKTSHYGTGGSEPRNLPSKVKVVLRGSEQVAKGTIDLSAIYAGEIVFEDVEVKQEK